MKICAVICEYNPFHNGHLYQLSEAKKRSGTDAVLCVMSGNFVQRGEAAVMDKYIRAKHAVLSGADAVLELPTVFATSNAEIFAKGAVRILSSIPAVTYLCFGAETADAASFKKNALLLNEEPKEVSDKIKMLTGEGMSFAKARAEAWSKYIPPEFLTSPNNILGLEYTRAILKYNANIEILPIPRIGNGYKDETLNSEISSASAIREGIKKNVCVSKHLPPFVEKDLPKTIETKLDALEKYAVLSTSEEDLRKVLDCTEGLENALKKAALSPAPLFETLTSSRYTTSRIRRIALQTLLKIEESTIRTSLENPLYLRVLAAKKERSDLLSALSESSFPTVIRKRDAEALSDFAKTVYDIDLFAEKLYGLLYPLSSDKNIFI